MADLDTGGPSVGGDSGGAVSSPGSPSTAAPEAASPVAAPSRIETGGQAPSAGPKASPAGRASNGRFVKGAGSTRDALHDIPDSDFEPSAPRGTEAPGEGRAPDAPPASTAAAPGTDPAPAPIAPAKFRLGDLEFDSEAHAVQNVKSLRGQFRSINERMERAERLAEQNRQAAEAWRSRAQLSAQGPNAQPQADQGKTDAKAGAAPSSESGDVDWGLYKAISDAQGPEVAAAWLFQEGQKRAAEQLEAKFSKQLNEAIAPFQQTAAHQERVAAISGIYEALESHVVTGADGTPQLAYPELQDPNAARVVGEIWARMPFRDEFRNSPAGLHSAVLFYRDMTRTGYPSTSPASAGNSAGAAAAAARVTAALTGQPVSPDPLGGSSAPFVRPAANGLDNEAEAIRRGIDAAALPDAKTGVYRR